MLDWSQVWAATAAQLNQYRDAGLEGLLTEDVVRFATIQQLVAAGVPPADLEPEWRRPGSSDSVDLVVAAPAGAMSALEFKYPREPREQNAPWTQQVGDIVKDYYRLAYMPAEFEGRWCVQLFSRRVSEFLARTGDRYGVRLGLTPGTRTVLEPATVRALPATALGRLERWLDSDEVVSSSCVAAHPVGGDLVLLAHQVNPARPRAGA